MLRFLLCWLLVGASFGGVQAQDWRTVRVGDTSYFTASIYPAVIGLPDTDTTVLRTIWISGLQPTGPDTTFHFFKGIRAANLNTCIDTAAPSWLGPSITYLADGRELYFNSAGDSIILYPKAPLFATWTVAYDTSGRTFTGTIGSVGVAMVDGVPDSVKTFFIQAFAGTTPVPHEYNNLVLQWSKMHGWIKALDFYRFPNFLDKELVGTQANRSQHVRLPKFFNQIDLDSVDITGKYTVGNEWMWLSTTGNAVVGYTTENGHDSVMSALPFGNGVIATVHRRVRTVVLASWSDVFTDTIVQDTILRSIAAPRAISKHILPEFKDQPMHETADYGVFVRTHPLYRRYLLRSLCGGLYRVGDRQQLFGGEVLAGAPCWNVAPGVSGFSRRHRDVVPGFGTVYWEYEAGPGTWSGTGRYEVYYFKFGSCIVGGKFPITPTGIAQQAANTAFSLYPNPAGNYFVLRTPSALLCTIKISDVTGRVVNQGLTAGVETQLPTAHLPSGVYFVEVSGREGRTMLKLQVLH